MCASRRPVALFVARNSMQIINQSFRVSKISRAEPICEPVVNWFDHGNRFSATALIAQQAGEARRGSQLPREGALPARPVERLPEAIFGLRCGGLCTQHQETFEAKQFSEQPPFVCLLASLDGLLNDGQSISNLASTA